MSTANIELGLSRNRTVATRHGFSREESVWRNG